MNAHVDVDFNIPNIRNAHARESQQLTQMMSLQPPLYERRLHYEFTTV